ASYRITPLALRRPYRWPELHPRIATASLPAPNDVSLFRRRTPSRRSISPHTFFSCGFTVGVRGVPSAILHLPVTIFGDQIERRRAYVQIRIEFVFARELGCP